MTKTTSGYTAAFETFIECDLNDLGSVAAAAQRLHDLQETLASFGFAGNVSFRFVARHRISRGVSGSTSGTVGFSERLADPPLSPSASVETAHSAVDTGASADPYPEAADPANPAFDIDPTLRRTGKPE